MTLNEKPLQASSKLLTSGEPTNAWYSLVDWNDLPHWQKDNQHIYGSYRQASYSYTRSFASVLHLHNETVNIWTHLLPAILTLPSAAILYTTLKPRYDDADSADVVAMSFFFAGAALCLGMSATFHSLSNHSPVVAKFWNQIDYAGIACLIAGSFVPSVFYGFFCDQRKQILYWVMIGSLGAACTLASVMPSFRSPALRPYRAVMFVGMGVSAVFPVLDGLMTYGWEQTKQQIGLFWLVLQGALYILGAGLYAARFPERRWPGKFDMIGSSHQIFHVLVVLAAISHLKGLVTAFDYRHGSYDAVCT